MIKRKHKGTEIIEPFKKEFSILDKNLFTGIFDIKAPGGHAPGA